MATDRTATVSTHDRIPRHIPCLMCSQERPGRFYHPQDVITRTLQESGTTDGEDRPHTRYSERPRGVDSRDPGVRLRATQDGGVEHVWKLDVVDERGLASKKPDVFPTPDRSADISLDHGFLLCARPLLRAHHRVFITHYYAKNMCA